MAMGHTLTVVEFLEGTWSGRACFVLTLVALALVGCAPVPSHSGFRVVSINPCVDAVLREVADPAQILAISDYSQDPRVTSVPLDWARRFTATSGTAGGSRGAPS